MLWSFGGGGVNSKVFFFLSYMWSRIFCPPTPPSCWTAHNVHYFNIYFLFLFVHVEIQISWFFFLKLEMCCSLLLLLLLFFLPERNWKSLNCKLGERELRLFWMKPFQNIHPKQHRPARVETPYRLWSPSLKHNRNRTESELLEPNSHDSLNQARKHFNFFYFAFHNPNCHKSRYLSLLFFFVEFFPWCEGQQNTTLPHQHKHFQSTPQENPPVQRQRHVGIERIYMNI